MNISRREFIEIVNKKFNLGLNNVVGVNSVRHIFNLECSKNKKLPTFKRDLIEFFKYTAGINVNEINFENINLNNIDNKSSISLNYNDLYDILTLSLNSDSKRVFIYRLEDKNKKGLFVSDVGINLKKYYDSCYQPSPLEDPVLKSLFYDLENREMGKNWYFGFKNKEDSLLWLGKNHLDEYEEVIDILRNNNINLVKYEVEEIYVLESDMQVCFVKNKSKLIDSIPFVQFLNEVNEKQDIKKNRRKLRV